MSKEKDLQDIKKITSINVKNICKKVNVDEYNLYNLKASPIKIKLVKDTLINELKGCIGEIESGDIND